MQPVHTESLTPKQRFQQSGTRLSEHRDLISSDPFKNAVDAALLELQVQVSSQVKDGNSAMAAGFRILGAQELVTELRRLGDTMTVVRKTTSDNLHPVN